MGAHCAAARRRCPASEIARLAAILQPTRRTSDFAARQRRVSRGASPTAAPFARWAQAQRAAAQGAGLRDRHAVAQEDRHAARRRRPPTQMDAIADLADRYSFGELRVSHEQNLMLRRRAAERPARALERAQGARARDAEHRPSDRHRLLPGRRLLLARQRQVDSDRRGDPARASTTSTTCTTSATSSSTSPAA